MTDTHIAVLTDRAIIAAQGEDVTDLLQGLVTVDMERLGKEESIFGALLAPQGKIQFDFVIQQAENGYLIDIDAERAAAFLKRMMLYKLRSNASFEDVSADHHVVVQWGKAAEGLQDPRSATLGTRTITAQVPATNATEQEYHAHRITCGIPEAGKDFEFDDIFPHDAMMDVVGGVNFDKGCYVGQEVVSRVQHRSTARKRFAIVNGTDALPPKGEVVNQDEKALGVLGQPSGNNALALVRVDKLNGNQVKIGDQGAELYLPDYFRAFETANA